MPGLVHIAVAAIASLIHCVHSMRLRTDRFPADVDSSFIQQESVNVCLRKVGPEAAMASYALKFGAVVLTSERLLVYVSPESLLPSCNPLDLNQLQQNYRGGEPFMYVRDGILSEARFSAVDPPTGSSLTNPWKSNREMQQNVHFTWQRNGYLQHLPFEIGKFYPIEQNRLPSLQTEHCAYPVEAASIAIDTIAVTKYSQGNKLERQGWRENCWAIRGCPDDECKKERVEWTVCFAEEPSLFGEAIIDAHLKKNDLKERLGHAIWNAYSDPNNQLILPPKGYFHLIDSFVEGIVPKKEDPNSRSGSPFFFSSDGNYVAKRIRWYEYRDGLRQVTPNGKYLQQIQQGSSLCPTYIAFQSKGDSWIVMRREQLSPGIQNILGRYNISGEKQFFADIKPSPMVSDRGKFHRKLGKEFLERGFQFSNLYGWEGVLRTVGSDRAFLEDAGLVDYSYWIYGTLFDLEYETEKELWESSMFTLFNKGLGAQTTHPGCAYGCTNPQRNALLDVTHRMGEHNRLEYDGAGFKCCCAAVSSPNFRHESPCVLVDVEKAKHRWEKTLVLNSTGCENLLGEGWHSYTRLEHTPANGKCIVGMGTWQLWQDKPHFWGNILKPESLGYRENINLIARPPWRCGVVCVSIGDYFLHLGAWELFESYFLIIAYREVKWSEYPAKMGRLLQGLGASPPFSEDFQEALSSSMAAAIANRVERDATLNRVIQTSELYPRYSDRTPRKQRKT